MYESEDEDIYHIDDESSESSENDSLISSDSEDDENQVIIEFDDFSDDEDDEIELDRIYYEDVNHLDSDKEDGKYYIGLCKYLYRPKINLMLNSVSARTFYRHSYFHVLKHLYYNSSVRLFQPKIEIMKLLVLEDGTYSVIMKTHWIRLIQRHWRSVLKTRKEIIKGRMNPRSLLCRETTGKFPPGLRVFPGIIGMMRKY